MAWPTPSSASSRFKDRTEGTGRFNPASGILATMVGIGAALSNTIGGSLIQRISYSASFLGLAAIAAAAFTLLLFAVPETLGTNGRKEPPTQALTGGLPGASFGAESAE